MIEVRPTQKREMHLPRLNPLGYQFWRGGKVHVAGVLLGARVNISVVDAFAEPPNS